MKKKYFVFHQDLYHQDVAFLAEWTRADVLEYLDTDTSSYSGGMTFQKGGVVFVWIRDWKKHKDISDNLEYLHHESIHAANFILASRGVKVSARNDEALTYLSQWIFSRCMACQKEKRKK